jgi:hypothetical protein
LIVKRSPMSGAAWLALILGAVGLLLIFSLPPDPWPYLGLVLVVAAPLVALVAIFRSRRPATFLVLLIALVPGGLTALALYLVATRTR